MTSLSNERRTPKRSPRSSVLLVLLGGAVSLPIFVVVAQLGRGSGGLFAHLADTVLGDYVRNTLLLAAGVATLTCVVGVTTSWLVTMCSFPGRGFFRWALLLPLAIPSYLSAYAYTDLLQFSGPVQTALRETFGWSAGDYWFPDVRTLPGAAVILSLGLFPYVFLAARSAFLEQSVCVLEVARTLGKGPRESFRRVALPLARPSIVAGLSLVLMETFAEFGAVQYCAVDTFATGIYRTFTLPNDFALTAAAQLSACLLLFVVVLLLLEGASRRRERYHHTSLRYRSLRRVELRGPKALLAVAACALPVVFGFLIPLLLFLLMTLETGDARAREIFVEIGANSLLLAIAASLLAVFLALVLGFGERRFRDRAPRPVRWAVRLAGIGYAIPGGVIAIGILVVATWLDRRLAEVAGLLFGSAPGLLLTGTAVAMIYGYQTRFLSVSLNFVRAALTRVRPSLDDAARNLGASPLRTAVSVHLPLLKGTLGAAGLLVFVDVIKELPATLIMRPFGFETLAVRVYQLASDERLGEASTGALAIIVIGTVPVLLLSRVIERSRPGTEHDG